jgi:uroporphyrinogen-III synthase
VKNNIEIISTASLPVECLQQLQHQGINVNVIPFINTYESVSVANSQRIRSFEKYKATAIFTSAHGVEAVAGSLLHPPAWKFACINGNTKKTVARYFDEGDIIAEAPDANTLADELLPRIDREAPVLFFCGNRRLDILPQRFKDAGIKLEEIEVYKTDYTPETISDTNVSAVLFFSTSAVDSFFSVNTLNTETICFAIGNTTAAALREKVLNKIVIAGQPGKKELTDLVIKYYHEHS